MDQWFFKARKKVRGICKKDTFLDILEKAILSDTEKKVLCMHYLEKKDLIFIADELGYSEQGILKIHKRALKIIKDML